MFGFAVVPPTIQFIGFLFLPESPRFLFKRDRNAARQVLSRIYNGDEEWIEYEMEELKATHEAEERSKAEYGGKNKKWIKGCP